MRFHRRVLVMAVFVIAASLNLIVNAPPAAAAFPAPLAEWGFDEGSGLNFQDHSMNGHNGTISQLGTDLAWDANGHTSAGLSRSSAYSAWAQVPRTGLEPANAITIMAWFKSTDPVTGTWRPILSKGLAATGETTTIYYTTSGANTGFHVSTSNGETTPQTPPPADGLWHHFAGTYDGSNAKLFLDGTQVDSLPLTGTLTYGSDPWEMLGTFRWAESAYGSIDDVRIFGQALNGTEITEAMNTPVNSQASNSTTSAIVDPSMTFTVAGRSSVCNGQSATNFQTGATGTAVSLGHLSSANVGGGAEDLSVASNAANGFNVFLRTNGTTPNSLRDTNGHSIADVSGTNASPGASPVAGTPGFGYTSDDALTAFTSNTWAKLTNTNDVVLTGAPGTSSKSACIGYEVAVASTTPAGSYTSNVIYTAVPAF